MNKGELLNAVTSLENAKEVVDAINRNYHALENLQVLTEGLASLYRIQRDEARQVAANYRDRYVGRVGSDGSRERLPWEAKK